MKWLALLGLLLLGQDPDVEALLKQLESDSIVERDQAVKALIDLGEKAEPKVRARMAKSDGQLRKLCGQVLERIAIPKPLRGVLPPISRVTIDAKGRAVHEVLEEFQRQTRIPMKLNRLPGAPEITVDIKDAAPLEALEAICRAAQFHWNFPSTDFGGSWEIEEPSNSKVDLHEGPEMHFGPGYTERPRLFIRHYLVELHDIAMTRANDFRTGKSRGVLNFGLHWPAGVNPYQVQFEVSSVMDDRGNQLFEGHDDPNEPKGPRTEPAWWNNMLRLYHRYRIRHPDKETKSLASIRGRARFQFLLREKKVTFEAPEKSVGVRKEIEGVTAEFVDIKPVEFQPGQTYLKARFQVKGRASPLAPRIMARLENGRSERLGAVPVGDPAGALYETYLYSHVSKITALEIVVESICGEDVVDFEFKDIPLPK